MDDTTAEGGKMSSRYYIVRPEEVIPWNERLSKLHGLTYDQLLQLISPNEVAVEFAARYNLISNSMNCKRCGQMMLLWSRNGLDGLQSAEPLHFYYGPMSLCSDGVVIITYLNRSLRMFEKNLVFKTLLLVSEMSVAWADYMRQIASGFVEASQTPIGGPGVVVEIGRLILYKTRIGEQHPYLIGMVERETENCIIIAIENYTTERLKEKVLQWILRGTILISDEGTYIDGLNQLDYPIFVTETYVERAHFEGYIREFLFRRTFQNGDEFAGIILWAPLLHVP
uniref:ISXO2-like transposase domain-containing protein n=1 Tax=Setaria digitata TaxID=48799 RepID=A0A915Q2E9_9BILA